MHVIILGEFSGVVRDAFLDAGHDAWSVDLRPTESLRYDERGQLRHHQCDMFEFMAWSARWRRLRRTDEPTGRGVYRWDLAICHPVCQYLANSGIKWLYHGGQLKNGKDPERWRQMYNAVAVFNRLKTINADRIAIENPRPHPYASRQIGSLEPFFQPWEHGHKEMKATGFHRINLPPLVPSRVVGPPPKDKEERRKWARVHQMGPGADREKERSRFLRGPARAMAKQWGSLPPMER